MKIALILNIIGYIDETYYGVRKNAIWIELDQTSTKGVLSPQGQEGMQLVIIKNYMNIFIFHK